MLFNKWYQTTGGTSHIYIRLSGLFCAFVKCCALAPCNTGLPGPITPGVEKTVAAVKCSCAAIQTLPYRRKAGAKVVEDRTGSSSNGQKFQHTAAFLEGSKTYSSSIPRPPPTVVKICLWSSLLLKHFSRL